MIADFITDLASNMNILLTKVSIVDGSTVGCKDSHILNMSSKGKTVSALAFNDELNDLQNCVQNDRLELKIRTALGKLNMELVR